MGEKYFIEEDRQTVETDRHRQAERDKETETVSVSEIHVEKWRVTERQ